MRAASVATLWSESTGPPDARRRRGTSGTTHPQMADDLTFAMGLYEARVPTDRRYSPHHMWLQDVGDGVYRVGLTAYSVRLLQDVYFLDWSFDPPREVAKREEIGEVESSKAVSALFAPADGRIVRFNPELMDDPSLINADGYRRGWLLEMTTQQPLLTAAEYVALLADVWDDTQRTIKGQMN